MFYFGEFMKSNLNDCCSSFLIGWKYLFSLMCDVDDPVSYINNPFTPHWVLLLIARAHPKMPWHKSRAQYELDYRRTNKSTHLMYRRHMKEIAAFRDAGKFGKTLFFANLCRVKQLIGKFNLKNMAACMAGCMFDVKTMWYINRMRKKRKIDE